VLVTGGGEKLKMKMELSTNGGICKRGTRMLPHIGIYTHTHSSVLRRKITVAKCQYGSHSPVSQV
jgi:hypothetical protein